MNRYQKIFQQDKHFKILETQFTCAQKYSARNLHQKDTLGYNLQVTIYRRYNCSKSLHVPIVTYKIYINIYVRIVT